MGQVALLIVLRTALLLTEKRRLRSFCTLVEEMYWTPFLGHDFRFFLFLSVINLRFKKSVLCTRKGLGGNIARRAQYDARVARVQNCASVWERTVRMGSGRQSLKRTPLQPGKTDEKAGGKTIKRGVKCRLRINV